MALQGARETRAPSRFSVAVRQRVLSPVAGGQKDVKALDTLLERTNLLTDVVVAHESNLYSVRIGNSSPRPELIPIATTLVAGPDLNGVTVCLRTVGEIDTLVGSCPLICPGACLTP